MSRWSEWRKRRRCARGYHVGTPRFPVELPAPGFRTSCAVEYECAACGKRWFGNAWVVT